MMRNVAAVWGVAALLASASLMPAWAGNAGPAAQGAVAVQADAALAALDAAQGGDLRPIEGLLGENRVAGTAAHLLRASHAAALLRFDEARAALALYFAGQDADPSRLLRAHEVAGGVAMLSGQYDVAARHAQALLGMSKGLPQDKVEGFQQLLEICTILSGTPPQALEAQGNGAPVPLVRDKVGLLRTPFQTGGLTHEAVVDTGANVSVASASAAVRMGLRIIEGTSSVGNSVGGNVGVRLGVADRLEFGGAVLRNVVFVIMEDAALEFPVPGGYKIDAIIGLPVLRAIGRAEFDLPAKTLRVGPAPDASPASANLRVIGNNPYVMMSIAGVEVPVYLDTGANSTTLYPQFAARAAGLRPQESGRTVGTAGVGGVKQVQSLEFREVPVAIGAQTVVMGKIKYEAEENQVLERPFGLLGVDILSRFGRFSLDFRNMVLEAQPPLESAAVAVSG